MPTAAVEREDVLIVSMVVSDKLEDIGKAAVAHLPTHMRKRYSRKVTYTLEDGRVIESKISGTTKPRLEDRIKGDQNNVDRKMVKAMMRNGECQGFQTSYHIGPR